MTDTRIDVKDTTIVRLRPTASSILGPTQAYTSVAVDDIELTSHHERLSDQRISPEVSRSARTPNELLSNSVLTQRHFWIDTWNDAKKFPLAWLARRFASHFLPFSIIVCLFTLFLFMSARPGLFISSTGDVCNPDGKFELSFGTYDPWKSDAIFAINLNSGSYSFGVAKLIDVCWDVGVGRGGQALLAIFSYLAFTKALSRTMEATSVTHDTFKAITLQNDTTTALYVLARDLFKTGGRRARLAMAWTIFATSFVLMVPTWLSAMTGYTADIESYVQNQNNSLVPAWNFKPAIYMIHDGARLGDDFQNDHRITVPWVDPSELILSDYYGCYPGGMVFNYTGDGELDFFEQINIDCKWLWAISKYVFDWGFLATSANLNTTLHRPDESNKTSTVSIDPPLNISANLVNDPFYDEYDDLDWYFIPYGQHWQNPETNDYPFSQPNPVFWDQSSQTLYNLDEFNSRGTCQQEGLVRYKWGFSFLLLYAFVVTFLIWSIGMWILYLDCWLHSRIDLSHRKMGVERAVLDLSHSMESKLDTDQVELHSNSQLRPLVKDSMLTYSDLPLQLPAVTRWSLFRWWWRDFDFKSWSREERWWLCAISFFTLMFVLSWTTDLRNGWMPYIAMFPGFGVFLVLVVGRGVRSRWVIFVFWFLLFWIPNCWWIDSRSRRDVYY